MIELGKGGLQKTPDITSTASVQELSSLRLRSLLGVIRGRASEEVKVLLRNAVAEVCRSRLKVGLSGEEQVALLSHS